MHTNAHTQPTEFYVSRALYIHVSRIDDLGSDKLHRSLEKTDPPSWQPLATRRLTLGVGLMALPLSFRMFCLGSHIVEMAWAYLPTHIEGVLPVSIADVWSSYVGPSDTGRVGFGGASGLVPPPFLQILCAVLSIATLLVVLGLH